MLLPLRTDSPLRTTPYLNWLLIAVNLIAFGAQAVGGDHLTNWMALHPRLPQLHQFITYQFAHASPAHLAGNMLFLFIFGNNVNDKMGHLGYLAFYLAGGVVAGLAFAATDHTVGGTVLGASGSIAAVTGAYLVLFPRSHISLYYWFFVIGRLELQAILVIGFFFVADFVASGTQDNVAHAAHIGGTIFGCGVCLSLLVTQLLPRDQFDVWALIQRWNKRRQYRDLVAKGYNPFDYTGQPDPRATAAGTVNRPGRRGTTVVVDERIVDLRDRITAALTEQKPDVAAELYVQLKAIDPAQVLSRQSQLDVATQLHHEARYPQAAEAYEALLRTYPKLDRLDQVELMLGLLYARYLHQDDRAKAHLSAVVGRVHGGRELDLAREELAAIDARAGMPTST